MGDVRAFRCPGDFDDERATLSSELKCQKVSAIRPYAPEVWIAAPKTRGPQLWDNIGF